MDTVPEGTFHSKPENHYNVVLAKNEEIKLRSRGPFAENSSPESQVGDVRPKIPYGQAESLRLTYSTSAIYASLSAK